MNTNTKLIIIAVIGIVIIASIIVYQFAQQQYAIHEINSQVENKIKINNVENCISKETNRALERNETVNYDQCDYLLK